MTNIGTLHYFLGLQLLQQCDGFFISQSKYVMDILTCFKMTYCKPCQERKYDLDTWTISSSILVEPT
jgi:hypothetical protein